MTLTEDEERILDEEDERDGKYIVEIAKRASEEAVQKTFAQGRSVTIARDGAIVKLYPDGHTEFVKKLDHPDRISTKKRVYKL